MIAIPADVGFGVDPAQALLATSAGPLAVPLAAPLGPFPPDLQQLILQTPFLISLQNPNDEVPLHLREK
ncbi:hypothetical protein E2320_013029 [Naja naja]|nr:hypothetical protein E2320_013029 [Naja naja]